MNNILPTFNDNVKDLYSVFKKNQYPESLINRVVKSYLDNVHSSGNSTLPTDTSTIYFKLPFLTLSNFTQSKVHMLVKKYCKSLKIKLAFSSFKIKNLIIIKDCVPRLLRSCVVYRYTCTRCNTVYIGETSRPFFHSSA